VTSVHCVSLRALLLAGLVAWCREALWSRSGNRGRANVLWPALMPTMRPDFCLTSFGILGGRGVSMEVEFLGEELVILTSAFA
jgi:hypothetical protein